MNFLALLAATGSVNAVAPRVYVEDLFKINVRTGTAAAGSVSGAPDLTGTAAVLSKSRASTANWVMADTERTSTATLITSSTAAAVTKTGGVSSFNSDGFSFGADVDFNGSGTSMVDYIFKAAPDFFDVVTWTGDGNGDRVLPHSIGSMPGMAICKATSGTGEWYVGHDSFPLFEYLTLNSTNAAMSTSSSPRVVQFDKDNLYVHQVAAPYLLNAVGVQYVAYIFGNDSDVNGNIVCSSYTGNGSSTGPVVDIGWEPQFLLVKNMSGVSNWVVLDEMRGMTPFVNAKLTPNSTAAETSVVQARAMSTGFQPLSTIADINTNGNTYVFMAIRRQGKPPLSATEMFAPLARTGTAAASTLTTGIMTDLIFSRARASAVAMLWWDRLRGALQSLSNTTTAAQISNSGSVTGFDSMIGVKVGTLTPNNAVAQATYALRRAAGAFDILVFKGQDDNPIPHALAAVPELSILKSLTAVGDWQVATENTSMLMNTTAANVGLGLSGYVTDKTIQRLGMTVNSTPNVSGIYYVAYLFATVAGITKVGAYTGDGSAARVINCGFSTGARFVMIKRSDAVGDWYLWDSARGIVAGNDPHLSFNTTTAEVATDDSVAPAASGFAVNQVAATNINVSGAQYVFLAIA